MKHKKFKKRFIILAIIILLTGIFLADYVGYIGENYELRTGFFGAEMSDVKVQTERDGVVEMTDYHIDENGELVISFVSEEPGETDAEISVTYRDQEQTPVINTHFTVNDMGAIIEKRGFILNCTGYMEITYSFMGLSALVMFFMIFSFIECFVKNLYSYSMITYGGIALYLFGLLVLIGYKLLNNAVTSLSMLFVLVSDVGSYFLIMMLPVMLIMAISVSISNLWLMRHEGYRPVNALGIAISVVWLFGIFSVLGIGTSLFYSSPALRQVRGIVIYIICYFVCMLTSTIVCAYMASRHKPPLDRDYIIILGCAIRSDGSLTPLLKGRVDSALQFEKRQYDEKGKHACFVPSGGQGSDEIISEGEAMERYLLEQGVPAERILREDKSVNTMQNLQFSRQVIENADASFPERKIAFATTNYHIFRGYILSKKNGFEAQGISAKTKWYFFPNAFLREFIGLLYDRRFHHIIFLLLVALFAVAVEYFV